MADGRFKKIDWEYVEELYRTTDMSNLAIIRQYELDHSKSKKWRKTLSEASIRAKIKKEGWTRDLRKEVNTQVKENLVRSAVDPEINPDVKPKKKLTDRDVVKIAAEQGTKVILRHRNEILDIKNRENRFLVELDDGKQSVQKVVGGKFVKKRIPLTLIEKVRILKDLMDIRAKRITLERQAHSLNDDSDPDKEAVSEIAFTVVKP